MAFLRPAFIWGRGVSLPAHAGGFALRALLEGWGPALGQDAGMKGLDDGENCHLAA